MTKNYSEDLKWRIIYHLLDGYSRKETAERLYISKGIVNKVWAIYNTWGCVIDPFRENQGRKKTFNTFDMKVLQELIKEKVDWFLDELVYEMAQRTGKVVSVPTLWRSLSFCGITRKKYLLYIVTEGCKRAKERNELLRSDFILQISDLNLEQLIFIDETAKDERNLSRVYGYSTINTRAKKSVVFVRGKRYTILPALTLDGFIAAEIIEGSCNKELFQAFIINQVIPQMNPFPGKNSVIIMDNARNFIKDDKKFGSKMSNIIGQPITHDTLLKTVNTYPLIDNHAHNLLDSLTSLSCPLEICFSEASGEALQNAIETCALKRGVQQLAKLYNCEATLEAIKNVTDVKSYDELCNICFEPTGIQCLLLDDGLDSLDGLRSVESHVGLAKCAKRIVRIEQIAEQVIGDLAKTFKTSEPEFVVELKSFRDPLIEKFESLANSDLVVSFKSIAAYRTGLNINCNVNDETVAFSLANFVFKCVKSEKQEVRLVDKILIDYILKLAIDIAVKYDIPIQFHTGFGDNDLDLLASNPLYLRELIETYPTAKIVLLHSAYPYTRQAGYLASVYSNVYVDFGLVFPLISATGQQANLKELFEICPSNKILFSTDGHYLPESFYVAAIQVRETLGKVLLESVENKDFTIEEAIKIAKQVMFDNSNKLYKLNLIPEIITNQEHAAETFTGVSKFALKKLKYNGVKYVRLGWLDATNILRFRAIPIDRFIEYTVSSGLTIARCLNALPVYADVVLKGFSPTGEILLKPDLNTIVQLPYHPAHAFVHSLWENKWTPSDAEYDSTSSEPSCFTSCPRVCLKNIIELARKEFGIYFLVGVESEFVLLKNHNNHKPYQPDAVDNTLYCASAAFQNRSTLSTIDEMVEALQNQNIEVEQFHPESAPGQFEIITGPDNPLTAADKVVLTRQTIYDVAAKNCLKATFIPKPFDDAAGTAAHIHISVNELDQSKKIDDNHHSKLSRKERSFIAGVLQHLKAIAALTLPTINSYERTADHHWTGKWICWGVENRESPIRICYRPKKGIKEGMDVNFEFKCVDATANPYIAVAALLSAGIDGIKKGLELNMLDCQDDPASLSPEARAKLGITERLPDTLEDSLSELKKDEDLVKSIGEDIIQCFITVKESELDYFKSVSKDKSYQLLVDRY